MTVPDKWDFVRTKRVKAEKHVKVTFLSALELHESEIFRSLHA